MELLPRPVSRLDYMMPVIYRPRPMSEGSSPGGEASKVGTASQQYLERRTKKHEHHNRPDLLCK